MANPPFGLRVPIVGKEAGKNWYGDGYQYGFTFQAGAVNVPPVPPQPFSVAPVNAIRSAWPQDQWAAQALQGKIIQPYPGDEPPGYFEAPEVDGYMPVTWGAQSNARAIAAIAVAPPVTVQFSSTIYFTRAAWTDTTWGVQAAYNPVAPLTLIYGSAPPLTSLAPASALRAAWPQDDWRAQHAAAVAGSAPPVQITVAPNQIAVRLAWPQDAWSTQKAPLAILAAQVNNPPPLSILASTQVRAAWPMDQWPAQAKPPGLKAPTTYIPSQPPAYTLTQFYAARAQWADVTWTFQAKPLGVTLVQPVSNPPPLSALPQTLVRATWGDATWTAQRAALKTPVPPAVNNPPPWSLARLNALRGAWPDVTWTAQAPDFAAPFVPVPPFIQPPVPVSNAGLYLTRGLWLDVSWPAQTVFNPLAFISSGSVPVSPVGLYVIDPEFIDAMSTRHHTFRFQEILDTEARVLTFDFSGDLIPGQTLTGTITTFVEAFADPTVVTGSQILNGPASFDSTVTKVLLPVQGFQGSADIEFYFKVTATTTSPVTTLVRTGILSVRG